MLISHVFITVISLKTLLGDSQRGAFFFLFFSPPRKIIVQGSCSSQFPDIYMGLSRFNLLATRVVKIGLEIEAVIPRMQFIQLKLQ